MLIKTVEHRAFNPEWNPCSESVWAIVTVLACSKSRHSNTRWVDEKTGEASNDWPMDVSWYCTVLHEDRIKELYLDFDDRGKSWFVV